MEVVAGAVRSPAGELAGELQITSTPPEETQPNAEHGEAVEEPVKACLLVLHAHIGTCRHDHHVIRRHAIRTVCAAHDPVREVADAYQDRHADLVNAELDRLLPDLNVGHLDLGQRHRFDVLHRQDVVDVSAALPRFADANVHVNLDVNTLPVVGPAIGGDRGPIVLTLEPAGAQFEVAFSLVARTFVDDHRLHAQRFDDVGTNQLVDVPRSGGGDEPQFVLFRRFGLRRVRADHEVSDAEVEHVLHPNLGIVVDVSQLAHRIRRAFRDRRGSDEVVRRGARGLEEEALHRANTAIGPVRQQHQGHRRAVLTVVGIVLPERTATAVGRSNVGHLGDDRVVLRELCPRFVPAPVVASPSVGYGAAGVG